MKIEVSEKRWSLSEIRNKFRRRTGYYKRLYKKQYPDIKDVVYIRMPKTGSSSLVEELGKHGLLYLNNEQSIRFYFPQSGFVSFGPLSYESILNKGLISDAFHSRAHFFTTVRNPFARTVSAYCYYKRRNWLDDNTSFDAFTEGIKTITFNKVDPVYNTFKGHLIPQNMFLYCNGKRLVNHLIRLESFDTDIKSLELLMDVSISLPHLNKSVFDDYRNYYSPRSISNVLSVYEKDFELLGYSEEL